MVADVATLAGAAFHAGAGGAAVFGIGGRRLPADRRRARRVRAAEVAQSPRVDVTTQPYSIIPLGTQLGEGPVWVARDDALWFVDVAGKELHSYQPAAKQHRVWRA